MINLMQINLYQKQNLLIEVITLQEANLRAYYVIMF